MQAVSSGMFSASGTCTPRRTITSGAPPSAPPGCPTAARQ